MGKQESFAKLTEDLENLSKSEEPKVEEVVEAPKAEDEVKKEEVKAEEEVVEEVKEEEPVAEEVKEEEPVAEPEIPEVAPQAVIEEVVAPEPVVVEEVKEEEVKEEEVAKSQEVSETDIIGAFEAVIKSFTVLKEELAGVKAELAELKSLSKSVVEPVEEEVSKSTEPVEEVVEEEVSKSVEEEVEPEGKAVEFIAKSEDGVPVEEVVVEEEPAQFVAKDHVTDVMDFFMKNAKEMAPGKQVAIRQAVARVKRGEEGQLDVDLFKEIVNFNEN